MICFFFKILTYLRKGVIPEFVSFVSSLSIEEMLGGSGGEDRKKIKVITPNTVATSAILKNKNESCCSNWSLSAPEHCN